MPRLQVVLWMGLVLAPVSGFVGCAGMGKPNFATAQRRTAADPQFENRLKVARMLEDNGRYAEARRRYEQLNQQHPENAVILHRLGVCLSKLGERDAAVERFYEAYAQSPANPDLLLELGKHHLLKRDFVTAEDFFRSAMVSASHAKESGRLLATAMAGQGRYDQAWQVLSQIEPASLAYCHVGDMCAKRGDVDEAINYYRSALAMESRLPQAKQALARLEAMPKRMKPQSPTFAAEPESRIAAVEDQKVGRPAAAPDWIEVVKNETSTPDLAPATVFSPSSTIDSAGPSGPVDLPLPPSIPAAETITPSRVTALVRRGFNQVRGHALSSVEAAGSVGAVAAQANAFSDDPIEAAVMAEALSPAPVLSPEEQQSADVADALAAAERAQSRANPNEEDWADLDDDDFFDKGLANNAVAAADQPAGVASLPVEAETDSLANEVAVNQPATETGVAAEAIPGDEVVVNDPSSELVDATVPSEHDVVQPNSLVVDASDESLPTGLDEPIVAANEADWDNVSTGADSEPAVAASSPADTTNGAAVVSAEPVTAEPVADAVFEAPEAVAANEVEAPQVVESQFLGYCPVVLHDERRLVEAQPEVTTVLDGYRYSFSSAEARDKFIADPELYLPVAGGRDVVSLIHTAEPANGTLYHSVWYRDQLFMFLSAENLKNFKSNPQLYVGSLPTVSQR